MVNRERKIALLRGINVGGKRKVLMADLKLVFEKMNFSNVSTYIQSGNVLFDCGSRECEADLSANIEKEIEKSFGFEVPVIITTPQVLKDALLAKPFEKNTVSIEQLHITFLNELPDSKSVKELGDMCIEPDKYVVRDRLIFIYCEGKYHKSKLTNSFFEKKLKTKATTRNWKTVTKLFELS